MAPPTPREVLSGLRLGPLEPGMADVAPVTHYDPSQVALLGTELLSSTTLPDIELYAVIEQTYLATLDTGDLAAAKSLLDRLTSRFPESSVRVQRLKGMYAEAQGDYEEAERIYVAALEQDETNALVQKRRVACLVSQDRTRDAIEALAVYVDAFMQDTEAWSELATLYLKEGMVDRAAFCYEELVMLRPQNHLHHVRYAEACYTLGRWDVAVRHYCAALELCRDNARALYGLRVASAASLAARTVGGGVGGKSGGKQQVAKTLANVEEDRVDDETMGALYDMAGARIKTLYEGVGKAGQQTATVVKAWLAAA
ncbi:ER membrane complex subunit 2 [Thoreauomyces humboldtii]|nr:ER membrane complex subunit 2 [Thoreauomyces humboldtii]